MREELEVWFGKSKNFQFDFLFVGVLWLHYQTFVWTSPKLNSFKSSTCSCRFFFFIFFFSFMVKLVQFFVLWNVPVHHSFQNIVCFFSLKVSQKLIGRVQRRRRYKLQIFFFFSVFGFIHQGSNVIDRFYNISFFLIIKLKFFL